MSHPLYSTGNKKNKDKVVDDEHGDDDFTLLFLPSELLERIFTYLTFDQTSQARLVCRLFDNFCRQRLNSGFTRADRLHGEISKEVKSRLPRRESERRNHALARHVDILSAVETRLSLLSMTYTKYIEMDVVCFVPGKVLDEMFQVLLNVRHHPNPPRAHELLQELRDISSMAMEHFDEKIVPQLKKKMHTPDYRFMLHSDSSSSIAGTSQGGSILDVYLGKDSGADSTYKSSRSSRGVRSKRDSTYHFLLSLKQELVTSKNRVRDLERKFADTDRKLKDALLRLSKQDKTLRVYSAKTTDLSKRVCDYDQKFVDIVEELARVRGACGDDKGLLTKFDNIPSMGATQTETCKTKRASKTGGSDQIETKKGGSSTLKRSLPKRGTPDAVVHEKEIESEVDLPNRINTTESPVKPKKMMRKNGGKGSKGKDSKSCTSEAILEPSLSDVKHPKDSTKVVETFLPDIFETFVKGGEEQDLVELTTNNKPIVASVGRKRKVVQFISPRFNREFIDITCASTPPVRITRNAAAVAAAKRFRSYCAEPELTTMLGNEILARRNNSTLV